jgi:competence protein ComEC
LNFHLLAFLVPIVVSAIQQILPQPQASLLSGILLGVDAGLPVVVQEDFRATGTTHIIAISG